MCRDAVSNAGAAAILAVRTRTHMFVAWNPRMLRARADGRPSMQQFHMGMPPPQLTQLQPVQPSQPPQ